MSPFNMKNIFGNAQDEEQDMDFIDEQYDEQAHMSEVYEINPVASGDISRIITLHPNSYSDAKKVGEAFRENVPVILNLTNLSDMEAKRMVDFASGLIFGLRGGIERVTNRVFLLSPASVAIEAEDDEEL